jgi:hypothetical protein
MSQAVPRKVLKLPQPQAVPRKISKQPTKSNVPMQQSATTLVEKKAAVKVLPQEVIMLPQSVPRKVLKGPHPYPVPRKVLEVPQPHMVPPKISKQPDKSNVPIQQSVTVIVDKKKGGKQPAAGKQPTKVVKKKSSTALKQKIPAAKPVWEGSPDDVVEHGWTAGWMKRTFERQGGRSKGSHDHYWYTPVRHYKLRSLIEVRKFNAFLAECNDDEEGAWKKLKGRI